MSNKKEKQASEMASEPEQTLKNSSPWFDSAWIEFFVVSIIMYALAVLAFNSSLSEDGAKEFVTLDDEDNFVKNDGYKGFTQEHLEWMWEAKHLDVWEPVAWFLKALVWSSFGLNAARWRDVQIFSHATGGALLYALCLRVLGRYLSHNRKQQALACAFGAAFWTLHPLRAEVVGWISCISYNFGVNFVVGSMLFYHQYLVTRQRSIVLSAACYIGAAVCFSLALACKTPTISTIFGFLFIDAFTQPKRLLPVSKWLHPVSAVTDKLVFVALALFTVQMAAPGDDPCENPRTPGVCLTVKDRFIRACWALSFYLRMTVWPTQHMPHYALEPAEQGMDFDVAEYILPCIMMPTITLIAVPVFLRELYNIATSKSAETTSVPNSTTPKAASWLTVRFVVSAAWLFYITWSLPAIGIIQHGVLTMGADRYHYLPALVVAPVMALLYVKAAYLSNDNKNKNTYSSNTSTGAMQCIGCTFVLVMLVILSRAASRPWTNTIALYSNAQRFRNTNTGFALNNFGYWYYRTAEWPRAVELFDQALMQEPDNIKGIINQGDIFAYQKGDYEKAVAHYEKYVEVNPRSGSLVNNMISMYVKVDRPKMADYHHWLVPLLQFDWSEENDETLAWAFQEHAKMMKHKIAPSGNEDRSALQVKLNATCWKKPSGWKGGLSQAATMINCLPSFVIIGAPRCGSTTLFNNLKAHPQIMLWDTWEDKELNFLNMVAKYDRLYAEALPALKIGLDAITGEASVRYFMHPQVPRRMFETDPNAKLIVTIRNPVLRAFSHWRMERYLMDGRDSRNFQEAVMEEIQNGLDDPSCLEAEMANAKLEYCYPYLKSQTYRNSIDGVDLHAYLGIGIYHHQLYRWLQYFPIEQFVFLSFEDMQNNADGVQNNINKITDHIGVDRVNILDDKGGASISNQNNKGSHESINTQMLRGLKQFYQPHNQKFYEMVGRDFGWEKQIDDMITQMLRASQKRQRQGSGGSKKSGSSGGAYNRYSSNNALNNANSVRYYCCYFLLFVS
jgi:tetratricopeptide (TPR) repeat protein